MEALVAKYYKNDGDPPFYSVTVWDDKYRETARLNSFDNNLRGCPVGDWIVERSKSRGTNVNTVTFLQRLYQNRLSPTPPQVGQLCPACEKPLQDGDIIMETWTVGKRPSTGWYHADC